MKTLQISEQSYFKGSIFGISKNRNKEQQYFFLQYFFFALFCSFEKSTLRQSFCCFISLIICMFLLFCLKHQILGQQLFDSSIIFFFFHFSVEKLHLFFRSVLFRQQLVTFLTASSVSRSQKLHFCCLFVSTGVPDILRIFALGYSTTMIAPLVETRF